MFRSRKKTAAVLATALVAAGASITAGMPSAAAASGCQNLTVNSGGYAQTTDEYAAAWSVSTGYGLYWYIKHTNGSIQDHGYVSGYVAVSEPANIYYLQISGTPGATAQVCYNG